ncbi:hypothetical protein HXX76_000582 [Chlamydomonas incerta]|uniref:Uncharacterized protein n=1 Tax=Chlamydomonas incerta TaxID=51695 RepID=A0A835WED6_CHLIN|nr:hypothetical protein HXX76_000582 [Chlamydomonas incerta]|eukprot:KAG2445979.1 hypothetical protein HXX76_000582 [Chlamydomonas incerta]
MSGHCAGYHLAQRGAPGCSAELFQLAPGPSQTVRWPAPQLLLRYAAAAGTASSEEQRAAHECKSAAAPGPGVDVGGPADAAEGQDAACGRAAGSEAGAGPGTSAEGKQGSVEAGASEASAGPDGAPIQEGLWSVMPVSLPRPPAVVLPAGCTLHAQVVSAITLLVALACSAAIISAALL